MAEAAPDGPMKLRALGFCGADDSVSPRLLGLLCQAYPFIEIGVLFRPDKEGEPRYATEGWVRRLGEVVARSRGKMGLAAHLCGERVNEVLRGDDAFVSTLPALGFRRVQINATAVNGVDTSSMAASVPPVFDLMARYPEIEFILQKNEETEPLWRGILETGGDHGTLPENVTMLLDESKGTGVMASSWPNPPEGYDVGYAGGIGPVNIKSILEIISGKARGRAVWIDMESSLRSDKNGEDVFDTDKCIKCIEAVCDMKLFDHPDYL